ncbi:isochorismate synthase [Ancylobacter sp. SL191]|uniref:isochorismate synthase n=1 Tax=Ancylobacter sp. SL191 TaxID=2995166 RepID=UPI0022700559|nr:isochorismate synthase [Ancylobacter sp. SL191]WAC28700.1 isochorismate synthase [Ancylobacter sp. SL191]
MSAPALPFVLAGREGTLIGQGCLGRLEAGPAPVEARVRAYFAARPEGPRLLVGALPYDMDAPAHLLQPAELTRQSGRPELSGLLPRPSGPRPLAPAGAPQWRVMAEPTLPAYRAAVAAALDAMARGQKDASGDGLRKIVLSRSLRLAADRPIDAGALLQALARDESVTTFCVPLAGTEEGGVFIGATPELLIAKTGAAILSHPLAGSARRHADAAADRAAAEALAVSEKDGREHRAVVEAILDQLAPYCVELGTPEGTQVTSTATMWHLGTRIVGKLRDPAMSSLELAARLHPTPAVCGAPRAVAARAIPGLEGYDRGFYAGAVGWCDEAGDGAWHVAIRCARIAGGEARLYAGAGIVPGSDPVAEGEETSAKFAALLQAFGIDEDGRPLDAGA